MLSSGFSGAPITRSLVYGIVISSLLASILDIKQYFYIQIDPHFSQYQQIWRIFTYQLCYTNSTEVLVAALTFWNMRVIERLWGSRKYASFLILSFSVSAFTLPLLLSILHLVTFGTLNYLPAGPTSILFSLLAQYHAVIPHTYCYRVSTSLTAPSPTKPFTGVTLSDKSYVYLPALQLSLSQFPGSLLCAVVGWVAGYTWRNELLPAAVTRWRIPGWVVGIKGRESGERFEGLRRRLEGEGAIAAATGSDGMTGGAPHLERRRPLARQLVDQFTGA